MPQDASNSMLIGILTGYSPKSYVSISNKQCPAATNMVIYKGNV